MIHQYRNDEAIILSTRRWSESSLIVRAFSATHGKVALVARGVRRPKSFLGAYYQAGSHVQLIWLHKAYRSLHDQIAIDPVSLLHINPTPPMFFHCCQMLRMVRDSLGEEQSHPSGFHQLLRSLRAVREKPELSELLLWQFSIRWIAEMGFGLELHQCDQCGKELRGAQIGFLIERGIGVCQSCRATRAKGEEAEFSISGEAIAILRKLDSLPEDRIPKISISAHAVSEIRQLLAQYTRRHLEIRIHFSQ